MRILIQYILSTDKRKLVTNYHVLYKTPDFNEESLERFAKGFQASWCKGDCNISLYDDSSISHLIGVYPLPDKDYVLFADHFIGKLTFDAPNSLWWYPFQDIKYSELGGRIGRRTQFSDKIGNQNI